MSRTFFKSVLNSYTSTILTDTSIMIYRYKILIFRSYCYKEIRLCARRSDRSGGRPSRVMGGIDTITKYTERNKVLYGRFLWGGEVHLFSAPRPTQFRRGELLWAKGYGANIAVTLRG